MAQKELKYLMIHCTATRPNLDVTLGMLKRWHMGPRNNRDGSVTYLGKEYSSRAALPDHTIDGHHIKDLKGRGWDRCGYSGMWKRDGSYVEITPYNEDPWVDESEKTWGAAGMNSHCRHFVYEGGLNQKTGRSQDTRNEVQLFSMELWVFDHVGKYPDIQILGHNQVSKKNCPSFDVPSYLRTLDVPEKNIYSE